MIICKLAHYIHRTENCVGLLLDYSWCSQTPERLYWCTSDQCFCKLQLHVPLATCRRAKNGNEWQQVSAPVLTKQIQLSVGKPLIQQLPSLLSVLGRCWKTPTVALKKQMRPIVFDFWKLENSVSIVNIKRDYMRTCVLIVCNTCKYRKQPEANSQQHKAISAGGHNP